MGLSRALKTKVRKTEKSIKKETSEKKCEPNQ